MKEDRYILLLYKQLNGEISVKESEKLNHWRQLSEENEQNARSVELAWRASGPNAETPDVDLDQEFDALMQRSRTEAVHKQSDAVVRKFSYRRTQWLAVAAGLALLLSCAWWLSNRVDTPQSEQWVEVSTNQNTREVILADGSHVKLNYDTKLRYRESFGSNPERIVFLEGEAFFEVKHDTTKAFRVETGETIVRVLGTVFNLRAYVDEVDTEVFLSSGKVQVSTKTTNEQVELEPGEVVIYDHSKEKYSAILSAAAIDLRWLNRRLVFDNTSLEEGLAQIESAFGISFELSIPQLGECLLTGSFEDGKTEQFINDLRVIYQAKVEQVDPDFYRITEGSCQ